MLNINCDTIKVLEENIDRKISDIPYSNIAIYLLGQRKFRKKINKWDYIKLKSFCTAKETIIKMKRELTKWESKFASDTLDKVDLQIYKELIQLNTWKTKSN